MTNVIPIFVEADFEAIKTAMVAWYENETGKIVQPGQAEMAMIKTIAYQHYLTRVQMQQAALGNLVAFAKAPILDYLGSLVGVERLGPAPAKVDITFTLVTGHASVVIPAGTRVSSTDGIAIFETLDNITVGTGINVIVIESECQIEGKIGNGYGAGLIKNILDPQAFLVSATNVLATSGGSDNETDEQLRDRIKIAPSSFSVAGPPGAYVFFAKTANPDIIDVAITNPTPGTVAVYPLVKTGIPIGTVLDAVNDVFNRPDQQIRPLNDTVVIIAPTAIAYTITANLTLYPDAISPAIKTLVEANLSNFVSQKSLKLGYDVMYDQVKALCMVPGVYSASLGSFADIIVSATQFAKHTGDPVVNISGFVTTP